MASHEHKGFDDLNKVAINNFRTLIEQNTDLVPEWKQAIIKLLDGSDIPQDFESISQLITGNQNA